MILARFLQFFFIATFLFNPTALSHELGPIKVLSLDGGGVRGIIDVAVLDAIEKELNLPISEIFDLVVGTSTGGITALGLVVPNNNGQPMFKAQDIISQYYQQAPKIFFASLPHIIKTGGGLWGPKYETTGLKTFLHHIVGNTKISQAIIPTIITGYHIEGQRGVEFSSEQALINNLLDCTMLDAALATAAAPVFFESVDINFPKGPMRAVADGGLYKNNPALIAYINALEIYPNRKIDIYSLGTGLISAEEMNEQLKGRGLLQWLSPIIHHLQIGDSEADNLFLHKLLNQDGETNFFRLNISVNRNHRNFDNSDRSNLDYLYSRGIAATYSQTYAQIIARLQATTPIK